MDIHSPCTIEEPLNVLLRPQEYKSMYPMDIHSPCTIEERPNVLPQQQRHRLIYPIDIPASSTIEGCSIFPTGHFDCTGCVAFFCSPSFSYCYWCLVGFFYRGCTIPCTRKS